MSFFTLVVAATALAIVVARLSGISSMSTDREVGHVDNTNRIAFALHSAEQPPVVFVKAIGDTWCS